MDVAQLGGAFEGAHGEALQHLFGFFRSVQTPSQERHKLLMRLDQRTPHRGVGRLQAGGILPVVLLGLFLSMIRSHHQRVYAAPGTGSLT